MSLRRTENQDSTTLSTEWREIWEAQESEKKEKVEKILEAERKKVE